MKNRFQGLWPAMFTPVLADGQPNFDELGRLAELLISQDLDGLYILGSTGQGVLFSEEQRKKVTAAVVEVTKGKVPVIVQVGSLTTDESVRLAKHAQTCGVDGISSVGPIYFSGSAAMALEHYNQIATATNLPFFPYQLGDNSIPGDTLSFINNLLKIPNVVGMKLTTNQLLDISLIHNHAGERLKLFSGSDELLCHASLCGTVGAIGTFYNLWGAPCKQIMTAFKNGEYELAKEFMLEFQKIIQLVIADVWTFLRKAMILKYNIDIGHTKAPLGNTHKEWEEQKVLDILQSLETVIKKMDENTKISI
ncbi:MAG: dihydrodipicolinate synthase family protein [Pedobacter sp.]|jgi:N-acetylneuraminate lyase